MQNAFGPGLVYVTRTDIANATPINVGAAQSMNVDFSANIKELYGSSQYPLDAARGTVKVSGKITAALISGTAWNNTFFGQNFTSGGEKWNPGEVGAVPASSPYTYTVANAATFAVDLGVVYATNGNPLIKVASAPAQGQYSVSAGGIYTFASTDAGAAVLFTYTSTVTTGQTLNINNQQLGTSPNFQLDYYTSRNGKVLIVRLFQCQASKFSAASKLEDYIMPEIDYSAFVNPAGQLGKWIFPEVD